MIAWGEDGLPGPEVFGGAFGVGQDEAAEAELSDLWGRALESGLGRDALLELAVKAVREGRRLRSAVESSRRLGILAGWLRGELAAMGVDVDG